MVWQLGQGSLVNIVKRARNRLKQSGLNLVHLKQIKQQAPVVGSV
ncbi:MAG: hypothetical protein Q9P01_16690 [Anaerolineae bacterium]|nr:hypothetical protein [Anaerolineae bacterium]